MRRIVLGIAVVGTLAGLSAPALARPIPPVPVSVDTEGSQVCVYGLTWGGRCVDKPGVR